MQQEIIQPESQGEWDILNRLNSFGTTIEIKPGMIVAQIENATSSPITAEELEKRVNVVIPCFYMPNTPRVVPIKSRRWSHLDSWRRPWVTRREF